MSKFLDDANAAPLTPELLGGAMEAIADLPEEDRRDVTAQMLRVIRYDPQSGPAAASFAHKFPQSGAPCVSIQGARQTPSFRPGSPCARFSPGHAPGESAGDPC